jgi:hypothetical protein
VYLSKVNIRSVKTLLTESYTITNQEIRLNEAADLGEPITIPGFTRVYTTPNAGQFQVLTFEEDGIQYGGKIIFNSVDEGKSVSVTYYGWGSIIWAEDFNNIIAHLAETVQAHGNHDSQDILLIRDVNGKLTGIDVKKPDDSGVSRITVTLSFDANGRLSSVLEKELDIDGTTVKSQATATIIRDAGGRITELEVR